MSMEKTLVICPNCGLKQIANLKDFHPIDSIRCLECQKTWKPLGRKSKA